MEALDAARASARSISHAFFAEHVTNALSIAGYTRTSRSEAVGDVALHREDPIDIAHSVALSAKPLPDRLTAVLSGDTSRFRDIPGTSSIFLLGGLR